MIFNHLIRSLYSKYSVARYLNLILAVIKKIVQFLLFLSIGGTILYLLFRNQNAAFQEQCRLEGVPDAQCSLVNKLWNDFSTVNLWWMLLVIVAFTISNIFRARRWQMQFVPLGHKIRFSNSLLTVLLGYFVNLGFPRMGEITRAGALASYERIPGEKVIGTLVVDRLMDFICLGGIIALAFALESRTLLDFLTRQQGSSDPNSSGSLLQNSIVITVLLLMGAGAVLLFVFRKQIASLPVFSKISQLLKGFWDGLRSVFKLKNPALFLSYSIGIWIMFFLQCWFNLKAFPPTEHLSFGAALMVFVFGSLGFVVPSPGGMGTFHAMAIASLALYGVNGSDAFSYANIAFFAIQICYNIVAGIIALVLLPVLNRRHVDELQPDNVQNSNA